MHGQTAIRTRRRAAALVALLLVLTIACRRGPAPPDPAAAGELDPAVRSLLVEHTDAVNAARSDASQWGRLAMAYEANGLLVQAATAYDVAVDLAPEEPRWRYRRALLTARRGEVGAALADLERVVERAPTYAPARWRQGFWQLDLGDPDKALASFRAAVQAAPDDPAAPIGIALVHLTKRADAEAAAQLERVLERTPGHRYALHLLGTAYQRLGRVDEARFASSVGSAGEPAWHDPWSDEIAQYRRGFAAMLKEATALGLERRYDEAIAKLEQLRRLRPDDRQLEVYLGGMYASAGRMPDAARILEPIANEDPPQFDAVMHLASGYLLAGDLDSAAAYATRALDIRPSSADASKLQGIALWRQGRDRDAMAAFEAAVSADPRDAMPHLWMGMILGQQARYAAARERFEAALTKNPLLGDALIGVADTYAAVGSFDQARTFLARAEQAEPGNPRLADARQRIDGATRANR